MNLRESLFSIAYCVEEGRVFFDNFRCIFNMDSQDKCECPTMDNILNKDLVMNVYQDGSLGSYRHVPLHTSKFADRSDPVL